MDLEGTVRESHVGGIRNFSRSRDHMWTDVVASKIRGILGTADSLAWSGVKSL